MRLFDEVKKHQHGQAQEKINNSLKVYFHSCYDELEEMKQEELMPYIEAIKKDKEELEKFREDLKAAQIKLDQWVALRKQELSQEFEKLKKYEDGLNAKFKLAFLEIDKEAQQLREDIRKAYAPRIGIDVGGNFDGNFKLNVDKIFVR